MRISGRKQINRPMEKKRSPYEILMGAAVQCKRIIKGTYDETRYTRYLESLQYLPRKELKTLQAEKLCSMMKHATDNIPYYKSLKDALGLTPESAFSDIKKFPILTKEMISAERQSFIDPGIPAVMKMKTGGTSKVKIEVIRDKYSQTMRTDEYFNHMTGIYPGMSRLMLSRHERDYSVESNKIIEYYSNPVSRTYLVKPIPLSEEKLHNIYKTYISKKPKILSGNTSTLNIFAMYIEDNNLESPGVNIIRGAGVKMTSEFRNNLQRVFKTKAFDSYGASETNYVSSQCEMHNGMHYVPVSHYIEILHENGEEADEGETGSIIITSLVHKAMPIIRYKIGDYASVTDEACGCGRTFPIIKSIVGREIESIKTDNGILTIIDLMEIFSGFNDIVDFQLIQMNHEMMKLNLVSGDNRTNETEENKIMSMIKNILGQNIRIEISYVPMIPILPNAKTLRVIPMTYDSQIIEKMMIFGKKL